MVAHESSRSSRYRRSGSDSSSDDASTTFAEITASIETPPVENHSSQPDSITSFKSMGVEPPPDLPSSDDEDGAEIPTTAASKEKLGRKSLLSWARSRTNSSSGEGGKTKRTGNN